MKSDNVIPLLRPTETNPKNQPTTHEYDLRGNRTRTIFVDGTDVHFVYDGGGQLISRTDQEDNVTLYLYDGARNFVSVTDPTNATWTYNYDELGNRISQTDPNNNNTALAYDDRRRRTDRTLPDGLTQVNTFDAVGNRTSMADYSTEVTTYGYDAVDREVSRTLPDGSVVAQSYTPTGNRETLADRRGIRDYAYDVRDRLTQVVDPDGATFDYGYDAADNLTSMTVTHGAQSWTETYAYDARNQTTSVSVDSLTFSMTYDSTGQLSTITYPNGVVTTYLYDNVNRLQSITVRNSSNTVLASWAYIRFPDGNIQTITEADGTLTSYVYDDADRLTQATVVDGASQLIYDVAFAYDSAGNRTSRTYTPAGGPVETRTYTYDSRDRITSDGVDTYAFDTDGRMLTRSGAEALTCSWDTEDRLEQVTYADGTVAAHEYDGDGLRWREDVMLSGGSATTTKFLVNVQRSLSHVAGEVDVTTGLFGNRYVRAGDSLLAKIDASGTVRYMHPDHLGSIRALTDANENVTDTWSYSPFGEVQSRTGTDGNKYLFAGERFGPKTELSHNRARWVLPHPGSFVSADSWRPSPSQTPKLGAYHYASSDPVNGKDPTGYFTATLHAVVGAAVLGAQIATAVGALAYTGLRLKNRQFGSVPRIVVRNGHPGGNRLQFQALLAAQTGLQEAYGRYGFTVSQGGATPGATIVELNARGAGDCELLGNASELGFVWVSLDAIQVCASDARVYDLPSRSTTRTQRDADALGLVAYAAAHEVLHAFGVSGHNNDSPNLNSRYPYLLQYQVRFGRRLSMSDLKLSGFFNPLPRHERLIRDASN